MARGEAEGGKGLGRFLLGHLAVCALNLIGRLPMPISRGLGTAFLPFYLPFRRRTRAKLRKLRPPVGAFTYYRVRLRLALLSVRRSLRKPDVGRVAIEEGGSFAVALSSGKPVLLLGWHQGPVELLHEVPAKDAEGRPVFVMTASAFSPVLAAWMMRGRQRTGVTVIRPDETDALRNWARDGGVLAVMVDQVPGEPEEWLSLSGGSVKVPWPERFVAWAAAREPEILAVSARLEKGRTVFRYDRIPAEHVKETVGKLMDAALARAPEQYNWSYGKIRVE